MATRKSLLHKISSRLRVFRFEKWDLRKQGEANTEANEKGTVID
jgi:hypothetical protein